MGPDTDNLICKKTNQKKTKKKKLCKTAPIACQPLIKAQPVPEQVLLWQTLSAAFIAAHDTYMVQGIPVVSWGHLSLLSPPSPLCIPSLL